MAGATVDAPALPAVPDGAAPADVRAAINQFEAQLRKQPQTELELIQHFCAGVYIRELRIPAGTLLTGKIHRYACLNIVSQGSLEVVTETGRKIIKAPAIFESPPGTKRAARVFSDTIWLTVHANPDDVERDSETMADLLTVPDFASLLDEQSAPRCSPKEIEE